MLCDLRDEYSNIFITECDVVIKCLKSIPVDA